MTRDHSGRRNGCPADGPGYHRGVATVVLMCGLPGSGKTTYAMELVRRAPSNGGNWSS